jgi:hypothetical protein
MIKRKKLTDSDKKGIIFAYNDGMSLGAIAALYGISKTHTWRIVKKNQDPQSATSLRSEHLSPQARMTDRRFAVWLRKLINAADEH